MLMRPDEELEEIEDISNVPFIFTREDIEIIEGPVVIVAVLVAMTRLIEELDDT